MNKSKLSEFSVALGLFDYINPICYLVTSITLIKNLNGIMPNINYIIMIIGMLISMVFGLSIPTLKLLVGLGKFKFKMPVNLVFYVNTGLLISGSCLLKYVFNIKLLYVALIEVFVLSLLFMIYKKSKKFNTVAVLIGAVGYIFIYSSLIKYSILNNAIISLVLFLLAILFFVSLCAIGIKANLKDAKVHWIIETCNVLCQLFVSIGTLVLFYHYMIF